jgi:hypothetical protein
MPNNSRAITGVIVALLAFGGTRALQGQQETGAVPRDTGVVATPGSQSGQMYDSSGVWRDSAAYAPSSADTTSIYAPPRSDSGTYAPPDSATYAPPDDAIYGPPDSAIYAPPG